MVIHTGMYMHGEILLYILHAKTKFSMFSIIWYFSHGCMYFHLYSTLIVFVYESVSMEMVFRHGYTYRLTLCITMVIHTEVRYIYAW